MANGHSFGGAIPAEIAAKLGEFLPEFGDLNHEELLQHQECVFQSLKSYDTNREKAPSDGDISNLGQFSGVINESRHGSFDQLELDEAFARSLQMEDDFDNVDLSHLHTTSLSSSSSRSFHSSTSRDGGDVNTRETPPTNTSHDAEVARDAEHDDIDPDNMSYEQLQSLGEAVGSESRGLPEKVIDRLPNSKYKTGGMFFKKKGTEECVICCMPFENGDRFTSLPCAHQYHSKCIKRWLQEKKNCPVCQTEVSPD